MEQGQFDQIARLRARQGRRFAPLLTTRSSGVCFGQTSSTQLRFTNQRWRRTAILAFSRKC
jgi:hypothetical protein